MSLFDRVNGQQLTVDQLQRDPIGAARNAGFNIPQNLANNPQAMVQHLIQSGQVSNPMMQRIMPMLQKMMGK